MVIRPTSSEGTTPPTSGTAERTGEQQNSGRFARAIQSLQERLEARRGAAGADRQTQRQRNQPHGAGVAGGTQIGAEQRSRRSAIAEMFRRRDNVILQRIPDADPRTNQPPRQIDDQGRAHSGIHYEDTVSGEVPANRTAETRQQATQPSTVFEEISTPFQHSEDKMRPSFPTSLNHMPENADFNDKVTQANALFEIANAAEQEFSGAQRPTLDPQLTSPPVGSEGEGTRFEMGSWASRFAESESDDSSESDYSSASDSTATETTASETTASDSTASTEPVGTNTRGIDTEEVIQPPIPRRGMPDRDDNVAQPSLPPRDTINRPGIPRGDSNASALSQAQIDRAIALSMHEQSGPTALERVTIFEEAANRQRLESEGLAAQKQFDLTQANIAKDEAIARMLGGEEKLPPSTNLPTEIVPTPPAFASMPSRTSGIISESDFESDPNSYPANLKGDSKPAARNN